MEGGGLECGYGDGGQPENREHHQWVSVGEMCYCAWSVVIMC